MEKSVIKYIPFGTLNMRIGEHHGDASTLRAAINVFPNGQGYEPCPDAKIAFSTSNVLVSEVRHRSMRTMTDSWVLPTKDENEMLISVCANGIYAEEIGSSNSERIYTFQRASDERKAQFAHVGERTYIATSLKTSHNKIGAPETVLEIIGNTVFPIVPMALPFINHKITVDATAPKRMTKGFYLYRAAWVYSDGSYSSPGMPSLFKIEDERSEVTFFVDYPDGLVLPDTLISGLAILITQPEFSKDYVIDEAVISENYGVLPSELTGGIWDDLKKVAQDFQTYENDKQYRSLVASLMGKPLFHVGTMRYVGIGSSIKLAQDGTEIAIGDAFDDDLLTMHGYKAGACFAYNGRLILGDTDTDFAKPWGLKHLDTRPKGLHNQEDGSSTISVLDIKYAPATDVSKVYLRFAVQIKTNTGIYTRFDDPIEVSDDLAAALVFRDKLFSYPDIRAFAMSIFRGVWEDGNIVWKEMYRFDLEPAIGNNVAYIVITEPLDTALGLSLDVQLGINSRLHLSNSQIDEFNALTDYQPNRMLVSDVLEPRSLRGGRVQFITDNPKDQIVGFAANSLATSAAQFGQFKLIVLSKSSLSVLDVGEGDVAFVNIITTTQSKGCIGRYGFKNVNGVIYVAATDGHVWTLSPNLSALPITLNIVDRMNPQALGAFTEDTALGYFQDGRSLRDELWVSDGARTFLYHLRLGSWTWLLRKRSSFMQYDGKMYGIDGQIWDEAVGIGPVWVMLQTIPNGLEGTGVLKRIGRLSFRQRMNREASLLNFSLFDVSVLRDGQNKAIEKKMGRIFVKQNSVYSRVDAYMPTMAVYGNAEIGNVLEGVEYEYKYRHASRLGVFPANIETLLVQGQMTQIISDNVSHLQT